MKRVFASAPGKVMLAGEYTVLDGAPAICMAVSRRARVSIAGIAGNRHRLSAPGFLEGVQEFDAISDIERDVPLLAAAWQRFAPFEAGSLQIEIDTSEFQRGGRKLGIGSSAAAMVALVAAFDTLSGDDGNVLQRALDTHRDLQSGRGSGADIACSFSGDLIEYELEAAVLRRLAWPPGLHYRLLWSGQPSSTVAQIEKFRAAAASGSPALLAAAARDTADAWRSGVADHVLAAMQAFAATLRQYDDEYGLGIHTAGHAELAERAAPTGVVYKPCGAGGGDLAVALAIDRNALHDFVSVARHQKFELVDLAIDAIGLTVEHERLE